MSDLPDHSEFNDETDGERLRRLAVLLDDHDLVDEVDLNPGGALDAARVHLRQYSGTVPEQVARIIYDQGLAIRSVGGYKVIGVSPPERYGGDLDDDEVIRV